MPRGGIESGQVADHVSRHPGNLGCAQRTLLKAGHRARWGRAGSRGSGYGCRSGAGLARHSIRSARLPLLRIYRLRHLFASGVLLKHAWFPAYAQHWIYYPPLGLEQGEKVRKACDRH